MQELNATAFEWLLDWVWAAGVVLEPDEPHAATARLIAVVPSRIATEPRRVGRDATFLVLLGRRCAQWYASSGYSAGTALVTAA
jgi:hypothetical protein